MAKKTKDATMPAAEFTSLRSYLASQGFTPAEIGRVIGAAASGRSRLAIAQILVSHLKTLPKTKNQ